MLELVKQSLSNVFSTLESLFNRYDIIKSLDISNLNNDSSLFPIIYLMVVVILVVLLILTNFYTIRLKKTEIKEKKSD